MKTRFTSPLRQSLFLSLLALPAAHAQSVWSGFTDAVLSTGSNFNPAIANTTVSNLNIQFDGTDATTEDLTLATAMGGGAGGAGSIISVLAAQTNPLTITGSGTAAIRLSSGLTVESDAGAVSFAGTGSVLIGGLPSTTSHTIANESANLLDFGAWNLTGGGGGTRNLSMGGAGDIEIDGNWANAVALNKTGAGTVTLGGTNAHTGTTTVSGGVLKLTNALALQSSALDTSGAGTITVDGPTTLRFGGLNGSTALSSVITSGYSGITELTLSPGSGTQTYSGAIANGATGMNLVKSGAGTQVLSGTNSYTGTTSASGGTLRLGSTDALGSTTKVSVTGIGGGIGAAIGSLDLAGITPATAIPLELNSGANNNDVGALQNSIDTAVTWSGAVELKRSTIVGIGNITFTGGFTGGGFSLNKNGLRTLAITDGGTSSLNELKANRGTIQVNSGTTLDVATIVAGSGNSVGSGLTLNGGSVTCSGTSYFGTATSGSASGTLTLNSGTLTVVGLSKGPSAGANVQFNANFNGGTLEASGDNPTFLTGANNARVQAGGALIDDGGFLIDIPQPLIHDSALLTPDGGLTKSGIGTLTLSGTNTYNGNTTVSDGTLELAPSGSLKFVPTAPGTTNKVTGTGTANFNGTFNIDLANADATTDGNAWVLADVPTKDFDETTFAVAGFTESPEGTWEFEDGTKTWTFTESDATLRLDITAAGFANWITGFGLAVADQDPTDDPDNDGMDNLLEFVLNGNPSVSDPSILPDLTITATDFEFTYQRRDDSVSPETTQAFQWGTTLAAWPGSVGISPVVANPLATVAITAGTPNDAVTDTVKVTIPKTEAGSSGRLFGRLMVSKP
jgi:autotransporter-associated beta strand protein